MRQILAAVAVLLFLAGCVGGSSSYYNPYPSGDASWEEMHHDAELLPERIPKWCETATLDYDRRITATRSPSRRSTGGDTFSASAECEPVTVTPQ